MEEGLDPTLGAILPLVGVALGAVLGGLATYALKRRDERAEVRAIARVLLMELDTAEQILRWALDNKNFQGLDQLPLRSSTWETHRLLMARHVDDATWIAAARAYFEPWGADRRAARLTDRGHRDERERAVEVLYGHVTAAQVGLTRRAGAAQSVRAR